MFFKSQAYIQFILSRSDSTMLPYREMGYAEKRIAQIARSANWRLLSAERHPSPITIHWRGQWPNGEMEINVIALNTNRDMLNAAFTMAQGIFETYHHVSGVNADFIWQVDQFKWQLGIKALRDFRWFAPTPILASQYQAIAAFN